MNWIKYTIETTIEAEDVIASMLNDMGIEGVQIEDGLPPSDAELAAMFIDSQDSELMPDELPSIDGSLVSFYMRTAEPGKSDEQMESSGSDSVDDSYWIHDRVWTPVEIVSTIEGIKAELESMRSYVDIGSGIITTDSTEESDWMDKWKDFYKPVLIGKLLILPSWQEVPAEYESDVSNGKIHVIKMDPGSAFGNGSHETTILCVDGLEKYVQKGDTVLDIGSGSGILGLAALSFGASRITATELDPACEHVIDNNKRLNGVDDEHFRTCIGNIIEDDTIRMATGTGYDIVVANILAPVIAILAGSGQADNMVRSGGYFITSGIINTREQEVAEAFRSNPSWTIVDIRHLGDWVSIVAKRQ